MKRLVNSRSVTVARFSCPPSIVTGDCLTQCLIKLSLDGQTSLFELESIKIFIKHSHRLSQASKQLLNDQMFDQMDFCQTFDQAA